MRRLTRLGGQHLGRDYWRSAHAVVWLKSFRERLQAGVQDFDVDFSARGGCACFCESDFCLKQFVLQAGELIEVHGGSTGPR